MRWTSGVLVLIAVLGCGNDNSSEPHVDSSPPAAVEDLAVAEATETGVLLTWTATGDDGHEGRASGCQARGLDHTLLGANWDSAEVVGSKPAPKSPGEAESLLVTDLEGGTWYFGVKVSDEVPNWSELSNVVSASVADTTPPGAVNDLEASFATTAAVELRWSATGDDSVSGVATEYDLRYSSAPITLETWDTATPVLDEPSPGPFGTTEVLWVTVPEQAVEYSFAIRVIDNAGNNSGLSNVVSQSTAIMRQLTSMPQGIGADGALYPAWSPNGEVIAFEADLEGGNQVGLVPLDGDPPTLLTSGPGWSRFPCWGADGFLVAFQSDRSGWFEIYTMPPTPGATPTQRTDVRASRDIFGFAWSPDEAYFAFVDDPFDDPMSTLFVLPADGGALSSVTRARTIKHPSWSPDGSQIAVSIARNDQYDIWVYPAFGGAGTQLTDDAAWDGSPAWSPDGSRIAFHSDRGGEWDIWITDADGLAVAQLTSGQGFKGYPTWAPDGGAIAFNRSIDDVSDVWIVRWDQ